MTSQNPSHPLHPFKKIVLIATTLFFLCSITISLFIVSFLQGISATFLAGGLPAISYFFDGLSVLIVLGILVLNVHCLFWIYNMFRKQGVIKEFQTHYHEINCNDRGRFDISVKDKVLEISNLTQGGFLTRMILFFYTLNKEQVVPTGIKNKSALYLFDYGASRLRIKTSEIQSISRVTNSKELSHAIAQSYDATRFKNMLIPRVEVNAGIFSGGSAVLFEKDLPKIKRMMIGDGSCYFVKNAPIVKILVKNVQFYSGSKYFPKRSVNTALKNYPLYVSTVAPEKVIAWIKRGGH